MNTGLLLLRLLPAALLTGHATQKLFGWFRGGGPAGSGALFETWGFRPGPAMATVAGCCELAGAASAALGLLTPLGCAVVVGTMTVAAAPTAGKGLWAHLGGCEVPVLYGLFAVVLAVAGPGRWSLDHALGLTTFAGPAWGGGAVALGLVAAIPMLLRRRAALRADTAP